MFKRLVRLCLAVAATVTFSSAMAAELPASAAGNGFASNALAAQPFVLDTSAWNGSSGSISATYADYAITALGSKLRYSGNWTYTGNFNGSGLNGKLIGSLQLAGLVVPNLIAAGTVLTAQIDCTFANGGVSGTFTVTLPGYGSMPFKLSDLGVTNQTQALALLFAN